MIKLNYHEIYLVNAGSEVVLNIRLCATRKKLGLTQKQVANKSKIAERMYQDYEYGTREPCVSTAIRIAKILDTTVEELFETGEK